MLSKVVKSQQIGFNDIFHKKGGKTAFSIFVKILSASYITAARFIDVAHLRIPLINNITATACICL